MIEPSINKPVSMSNVNIVKVTVQCSLRSKQSSLSVLMTEATQGLDGGGQSLFKVKRSLFSVWSGGAGAKPLLGSAITVQC